MLPLFALFIIVLLGITAMVVDTGRGWVMKRELQRTADAAALAGASYLPDQAAADAAARDYIARNPLRDGLLTSTQVSFQCLAPSVDCTPYNAVKVSLGATAETTFAKVMAVDTMNAAARSIAMSNQPRKFDVMIVLDRTGSMSASSKLTNAKAAIRSFYTMVDPAGVNIGLTIFPPAPATGDACSSISNPGVYNAATSKWSVVALRNDYAVNGVLNATSPLVTQLNCMGANGNTHYTYALRKAKQAMAAQGRADAQDIYIFLTDGAANIAPTYATTTEKQYPCGSGVTEATSIKGGGARIFSIAYNVTDAGCLRDVQTWSNVPEGMDPLVAVQQIGSPNDYYYQPTPTQLTSIFRDIAGELGTTRTKMRDDDDF